VDFNEAGDDIYEARYDWVAVTLAGQVICASFKKITIPAPPYHTVFYRLDALPDAQPTVSKH